MGVSESEEQVPLFWQGFGLHGSVVPMKRKKNSQQRVCTYKPIYKVCFCLLTGLNMVELASVNMVVDWLVHACGNRLFVAWWMNRLERDWQWFGHHLNIFNIFYASERQPENITFTRSSHACMYQANVTLTRSSHACMYQANVTLLLVHMQAKNTRPRIQHKTMQWSEYSSENE